MTTKPAPGLTSIVLGAALTAASVISSKYAPELAFGLLAFGLALLIGGMVGLSYHTENEGIE